MALMLQRNICSSAKESDMPNPFAAEQFASVQKAQIDGLLTLANTAFAGMERLAVLNLNAARSLLEDGAGSARALLGATDVQSFAAIQGSLIQPTVDKAVLWSRSVYEIGSATREELNKTLEAQFAEANLALDSSLDELVKHAPAGTDAAVSASVGALKSAVGAANSAYETISKASKQAAQYAESNLATAAKQPAAKTKKA
jgi:phasin family protein